MRDQECVARIKNVSRGVDQRLHRILTYSRNVMITWFICEKMHFILKK